MRRFGVGLVACAAVGTVVVAAHGGNGSSRVLPLRSPAPATAHLTAIVESHGRWQLARVAPSTLRVVRTSAPGRGGAWGWAASPDGRRVAVAGCRHKCNSFWLRFASAGSLRVAPGAVPLHGDFYAALWPRPRRLYALAGGETSLALDTVDTATRRVVASRPLAGPILQIARSADDLVVLAGAYNAIVPVRLVVIGPGGSVRSVTLSRIRAGRHYDRTSQALIGTTNMPGLALDPANGMAYVIDPSGLVAAVDLSSLGVAYHQLGSGSLLSRIAAWLAPTAEAKGTNGTELKAQWLGNGLIAVADTRETATAQVDSYRPAGLRIVDTRSWSVRTIDPRSDTFMVADHLLLATGVRSSYGNYQHVHGEGLAAYGPDGALRWRLTSLGQRPYLVQAYRSHVFVDVRGKFRLVDLATGRVVPGTPSPAAGALLLGPGSPTANADY